MLIAELLALIPKSSEAKLLKLLNDEKQGEARPYVLNRIYGRYSSLRTQRERRELAEATLK